MYCQTLQAQRCRRITQIKNKLSFHCIYLLSKFFKCTLHSVLQNFPLNSCRETPVVAVMTNTKRLWGLSLAEKRSSYQYPLNSQATLIHRESLRNIIAFAVVIYPYRNAKRLLKNWKSKGKRKIELKRYAAWLTILFILLYSHFIWRGFKLAGYKELKNS